MARKPKEYIGNAGIVRRLLAFLIDIFLLELVVLGPFRQLFASSLPSGNLMSTYQFLKSANDTFSALYASSVAIALIALLYFAVMEWKFGQTVGKMLTGIFVVAEQKEFTFSGEGIRLWQAIVRSIYFVPIFPFFILIIIDPVFMFFNRQRQRLSEMLSMTKVVEKYKSQALTKPGL